LSADTVKLVGIDIGGTKTALVVGTPDGRIVERRVFPSRADRGPDAMLANILAEAKALASSHSHVAAVGASVGGPVDAERGLVLGPPNLPGWNEVHLARELERGLGLPARIEHDAKACALAEWRYGAGQGTKNMVFLTLGTGVGAGLIVNGQLVRGIDNMAGEVGHWRISADGPLVYGKRGSLEGWASGTGLLALARYLHPQRFADTSSAAEVGEAWRAGDADATDAVERSANALGTALALLVDLLAPEVIVLGNLANRLGPSFVEMVEKSMAAEALPALAPRARIVCCALGEAIGDMAALSIALEAYQGART